jgi:mannose-6-phosphate isomerase-like protein (cupin superfamily)
MNFTPALTAAAAALAVMLVVPGTIEARDKTIEVMDLDTIVRNNPLPPGGGSASVAAALRAGKGELQIVVASRIRLHVHDQDHIVFVARGSGAARIENATGEIETRQVKPGDIIDVPRGKKHAFEKTGEDNLVLLVVTTPSRKPPKFYE